jgi:hypothetical protein
VLARQGSKGGDVAFRGRSPASPVVLRAAPPPRCSPAPLPCLSAGSRPGAHHHSGQLPPGLWLPAGQRHTHRVVVGGGAGRVGAACAPQGCGWQAVAGAQEGKEQAGRAGRTAERRGEISGGRTTPPTPTPTPISSAPLPLPRFDDDGDEELLKLIPFLEKVVHAEDVRPHIQVGAAAGGNLAGAAASRRPAASTARLPVGSLNPCPAAPCLLRPLQKRFRLRSLVEAAVDPELAHYPLQQQH